MKSDSLNFHQPHAIEKDDRAKLKLQTLFQEFLELQKEFVSKKRKLHTTKQKKDSLLAEVRFLRQKRRYLLKVQSFRVELEKDLIHHQSSDIVGKMVERERNDSANEATLENPYPVLASNLKLTYEEEKGEQEQVVSGIRKNTKSYLIHDKSVGKKKISWKDPATLKV